MSSDTTSASSPIFRPRIVNALKGYNAKTFTSDLTAGITVGIVALPLAMAFAIASGVKPEAGLFTAIIAGFIISAFGGSQVQIGGPTGAFIIIVAGILAQYGPANLAICTMMAGVILLIMGFARLGAMIKFIPYPITMGFTSGIAVLILSTQLKDYLGLTLTEVPVSFVPKMSLIASHLNSVDWHTFSLAIVSTFIIFLWPKSLGKRVPGSVIALVFGTLVVILFHWPVETIGTRFGGIPRGLPEMQIPAFDWKTLELLIQPATTIALLAAIESLLSAVVADGMIEDRHDSNQELIGQGLANLITPLFGGIAATGAIARTATNVRSGARTPVAGIIHALTLLVIILLAAPLARHIPLATLSAVLVMIALRMGEWHHFIRIHRWPKSDAAVFLTAFLLTVFVDLTVAVEVGMVLAAVLFIKRIADSTQITEVNPQTETEGNQHSLLGKDIPDKVQVFRIFGSFSFGVADRLETILKRAGQEPEILILRMRKVLYMDATGLNALEDLYEKLLAKKRKLILVAPRAQPFQTMRKAGFLDRLGMNYIAEDIDDALRKAKVMLENS